MPLQPHLVPFPSSHWTYRHLEWSCTSLSLRRTSELQLYTCGRIHLAGVDDVWRNDRLDLPLCATRAL